jgi:hypothetical protein
LTLSFYRYSLYRTIPAEELADPGRFNSLQRSSGIGSSIERIMRFNRKDISFRLYPRF